MYNVCHTSCHSKLPLEQYIIFFARRTMMMDVDMCVFAFHKYSDAHTQCQNGLKSSEEEIYFLSH